jgi:hypothetical protein
MLSLAVFTLAEYFRKKTLAKLPVIATLITCLGCLGRRSIQRSYPIYVESPWIAKAIRATNSSWAKFMNDFANLRVGYAMHCILRVAGWDHRDRTRASTLCFFILFYSEYEHVKSLLIMGPNNTKNSSLKFDFHITHN